MSYIQSFLSLHLPQYFLHTLRTNIKSPDFLKTIQPHSLYSLTHELLSLRCMGSHSGAQGWLWKVVREHLWIGYECLREFKLPVATSDSEIVAAMKSSLGYVRLGL